MSYNVSKTELQNALQSEKKEGKLYFITFVVIFIISIVLLCIKDVLPETIKHLAEGGKMSIIINVLGIPPPLIFFKKGKDTIRRIKKYIDALEIAPDDIELQKKATDFYFQL